MINAINYKIIEDFVATIYSTDIDNFGNKSYYPAILKIISSVNLRSFKDENIICDDKTFCDTALGTNINAVARGLNLPRETCLLYTSPSPRDATLSRMPSSA